METLGIRLLDNIDKHILNEIYSFLSADSLANLARAGKIHARNIRDYCICMVKRVFPDIADRPDIQTNIVFVGSVASAVYHKCANTLTTQQIQHFICIICEVIGLRGFCGQFHEYAHEFDQLGMFLDEIFNDIDDDRAPITHRLKIILSDESIPKWQKWDGFELFDFECMEKDIEEDSEIIRKISANFLKYILPVLPKIYEIHMWENTDAIEYIPDYRADSITSLHLGNVPANYDFAQVLRFRRLKSLAIIPIPPRKYAIPPDIAQLTDLEHLSIDRYTILPDEIAQLPSLKTITIEGPSIKDKNELQKMVHVDIAEFEVVCKYITKVIIGR